MPHAAPVLRSIIVVETRAFARHADKLLSPERRRPVADPTHLRGPKPGIVHAVGHAVIGHHGRPVTVTDLTEDELLGRDRPVLTPAAELVRLIGELPGPASLPSPCPRPAHAGRGVLAAGEAEGDLMLASIGRLVQAYGEANAICELNVPAA